MSSSSPPVRKPSGARPAPGKTVTPSKLFIPEGNVPGMNVDQAGQGGWQQPAASLPAIPQLAFRPMMKTANSLASSSRPKLSLSGVPSPAATPPLIPTSSLPNSALPTPIPNPVSLRPPLLNASSAPPSSLGRSGTPALKLSIPGLGGNGAGGSGFSMNHEYPTERNPPSNDDDLGSNSDSLNTPIPGEDRNPTLIARGRDYDGGESSYGFGMINNGLHGNGHGNNLGQGYEDDAISSMTTEIKAALQSHSRSRFESSSSGNLPLGNNRSRAGSTANSSLNGSRSSSRHRHGSALAQGQARESRGSIDDLSRLQTLSLTSSRQSDEYDGEMGTPPAYPPKECVDRGDRDHEEKQESPTVDPSELVTLKTLGEGSEGAVELVKNRRTGQIMAKKVIARTTNPAMHKQLLRELEILNSCASPYIVEHYGSFLAERDSQIGILMEYCEAGSLDGLLSKMKKTGMRCSEHVLGRIAASVLKGLDYLHERRIIHRDIKPSNIVLTRSGVVKLCDFGVSGELVDSIAGTFTGTSYYMAPERIQGRPYSIRADVWSLGLTLHEVAHLRFPFPPEGESQYVAPIELLSYIVNAPVPTMIDDPSVGVVWSEPIKHFMSVCLIRDGTERPYPWQLLQHPYITASEAKRVNMAKWVAALCDWPPP